MFIRKLRPNERASATVDHICIDRWPDGMLTWSGSVSVGLTTLVASGRVKFGTIQEAETDAIKWARAQGTSQLLIDVSAA